MVGVECRFLFYELVISGKYFISCVRTNRLSFNKAREEDQSLKDTCCFYSKGDLFLVFQVVVL